jgi:hypothetical protein
MSYKRARGAGTLIALPYFVLDAQLERLLRKTFAFGITSRRVQLSSGSARHELRFEKHLQGWLEITATHHNVTEIGMGIAPDLPTDLQERIRVFFSSVVDAFSMIAEDSQVPEAIAETTAFRESIAGLKQTQSDNHGSSGRRSWPEDTWAWEQVNSHKRPREDVKPEWLARLSANRPLEDVNRSFRYAVDSRRRRKN